MTMTDFSHAPHFDTGPLSWVMSEIREALVRSREALLDAAARSADAQGTPLQHARAHLHQAHGALQMVDVDGVGALTACAEEALQRFRDGAPACDPASAKVVADLYQAVIEYLEELLSGAVPQPARLFPYYRDIQQLLGAARIHPADLFHPDLSARVDLPPAAPAAAPDYAACRARFEKALLPFLKSSADEARRTHAAAMRDAIGDIADGQQDVHARAFWLAMHSVAALVASGQLAGDLYVKQLFGLINLQIRRLSQGQGSLPEAMLRDALFFIAAAPEPFDGAIPLRRAYRLDGMVPADYETRRYGRIDAQALKEAREALAQAQAAWDRVATGIDPAGESAFANALAVLEDASTRLGATALAQLLRELGRVARDSIAAGRSDQFSLEMAAALLFVEHGLDQVRQLPADFDAQAEVVGARLLALAAGETPAAAPEWQGNLSRQIQQGQTVAVLADEMKAGLRQVEKVLDDYYADPARRPTLAQIDPVLHQLHGALAILDQDHAMRAASHVRDAVRLLASGDGDQASEAASLQNIAQNVGALGFFADMLGQNVDTARERFEFDQNEGMFRQVPFEKAAAAATPFDQEDSVPPPAAPVAEELAPVTAPAVEEQGEAAIEAELLEIFIGEAQEVLAFVAATLPAARNAPADQETLTLLRRSFHTLKGSGRMVGLDSFADAAAGVERVMNVWLSEAREASPDLLALLDHATQEMTAWVDELVQTGASRRSGDALAEAAARVQDGGPFAAPQAAPVPEAPAAEARAPSSGNVIEFPGNARPAVTPPEENARRIGDLAIPLPLYNIYVVETDELMRLLTRDFSEWRHEPDRPVTAEALKASHTLAGTSATVGFKALCELAHALEMVLQALAPPAPVLDEGQRALLDETLERAGHMLQRFAQGALSPAQPELVARLEALREQLDAPAGQHADGELTERLDALFAATLEELLDPPPVLAEAAPRDAETAMAETAIEAGDMYDAAFDDAFDAPELEQAAPPPAPPVGGDDDIEDDELALELISEAEPQPSIPGIAPVGEPEPEPEPEPGVGLEDGLQAVSGDAVFADEIDPDLLPVFLEEASDLLPEIGQGLRQWQQNPQDGAAVQSVLRALHTVKGSARMAGAMRLGQHTHEIETQIENMVHAATSTPAAFDELMVNYDQAMVLFEQLQQPAAPAPAPVDTEVAPDDALAAQARTPLVRVRADILDRLVNQAGEVSITRSKLENQVGTLKTSLSDFADNLARLRQQLREVEMQAESQIASRMSIAGEREFDPLEFDRFTRLQELTRMMAESVSDVASFHDSLTRSVDAANADLAVQSRLTRDLQRDLMRVRMVPFASLSERLFRVARQAAKEVDKRVNLDIRGGSVEIDRSVLEQMAAPFEHLLRNAIVHGIEARERRVAGGKAETGELLVQASQQGNEVVIQFSDDGAGLDLDRIRAKARESGLLGEGIDVSDAEAADLIFEPGFSTAESLTELAGRGVGMDVVRAESQALGGRIAIVSEPGKGARFTIHLPLTLAVTQVVLTSSAGKSYALPSVLVEQVLQVKEAALAQAHAAGHIQYQGQRVALHYLPALLGDPSAQPAAQRSCPVMVLKSGSERVAVHVDEVQGNREVVIKNIGPQLARMAGIAGATVLGSGDIVLILNPVALAHHGAHHALLAGRPANAPAPEALSRKPVIMVVDDSLTVRKVTQRLLEREGFQVMLAKDGVDALEHMQEIRPDLMLVDIEMPRMDGFDLTRNVRGNEATQSVPIIMITSRTADKHRNYALDLGVNAYFGKPYQEDALLAAINGLLQRELKAG
ncbi:Hpt domain-containing protein [Massilia sp. GCM10020059]|uniref:histidine kinase n=1 Tax=Massilia agrisoli TaxID=2892444 RepID=A0ABS8IXJ7_9BURK|nr:Hpt domain-containing protein [Massilia agrisoli]MCC6073352.1 Hpt domain-containing protein [Massilia agrisoli]